MADLALSITMFGALALLAGGAVLWAKRGERGKGLTMIAAGLVALANVAIWSLPAPRDVAQRP